ncbi:MAG: recombinase family protein [Caulobacteraceae bacterium]
MSRLRCAIYTRKSSEEGLDQNFNSLHAQRESCEAYVLSQAGEGWTAIKTAYDDGGFSGGSMQRPALQQLLADIAKGLVDVVVVYKVDRLTRSLEDFAKIVELFDARKVSFVSVTQAFNTTSSMGRLTLNVLLSFAQFEREVTGERIRDKIAASRAKGLRTGARPPLGYEVVEGRLVIAPDQAETVRVIFQTYLEAGSVKALEQTLAKKGIVGRRWTTKAGRSLGGTPLARGPLYYLLSNPVYRGITRHKDKQYEGTHPAIIDTPLWTEVQARLQASNGRRPTAEKRGETPALTGLLFDDRGHPMIAVHTTQGAKRYRYYLSRAKMVGKGQPGSLHRISAGMIEGFLSERLGPMLPSHWAPDEPISERVRAALLRIDLSDCRALVTFRPAAVGPGASEVIELPFHRRHRQGAIMLEADGSAPKPSAHVDRALVRSIVLARAWARQLEMGEIGSIKELARTHGLCEHYTARLLPLAYLAPTLVQAVLEGRQHRAVSLAALTSNTLPITWSAQQRQFNELGH